MNADGILGANEDILGYNLYAYVSNNWINSNDEGGSFALAIPFLPALGEVVKCLALAVSISLMGMGSKVEVKEKAITKTQEKTKEPNFEGQTIIYRTGSSTNYNLTPRLSDKDGLSFTSIKPEEKYTMTTVELVNSTNVLKTVNDRSTHYKIVPANDINGSLHDWRLSKMNADNNPHFYTIALKSVLWDSKGNYCGIGGK